MNTDQNRTWGLIQELNSEYGFTLIQIKDLLGYKNSSTLYCLKNMESPETFDKLNQYLTIIKQFDFGGYQKQLGKYTKKKINQKNFWSFVSPTPDIEGMVDYLNKLTSYLLDRMTIAKEASKRQGQLCRGIDAGFIIK